MKDQFYIIDAAALQKILERFQDDGYEIIAPKVEGGVMTQGPLGSGELPATGYVEKQAPGSYRLEEKGEGSWFSHTLPMQSWRRFLNPPEEVLFRTRLTEEGFEVEESEGSVGRRLFFGVRGCDTRGIEALDQTFLHQTHADPYYASRREGLFVIAADCFFPAQTCFCTSMGDGPVLTSGFDIALSEIQPGVFLARGGSEAGLEILTGFPEADGESIAKRAQLAVLAEKAIGRSVDINHARRVLTDHLDHHQWDKIAARCLSCANCTLVCPTCFCGTIDESPSLDSQSSERIRRWDSCFHISHSYIHGGHIRASVKSRYRQWLSHKLLNQKEQSGVSGCTGCGRCITWCPAGIDLTEELSNFKTGDNADVFS